MSWFDKVVKFVLDYPVTIVALVLVALASAWGLGPAFVAAFVLFFVMIIYSARHSSENMIPFLLGAGIALINAILANL